MKFKEYNTSLGRGTGFECISNSDSSQIELKGWLTESDDGCYWFWSNGDAKLSRKDCRKIVKKLKALTKGE